MKYSWPFTNTIHNRSKDIRRYLLQFLLFQIKVCGKNN